jgi:hypothetical protein
MGTWGVGAFANDAAADWQGSFEYVDLEAGLELIRDALNGDEDVLAVAAAEMVATINGQPVPPVPDTRHHGLMDYEAKFDDEAMSWIARTHPASDPQLTGLARRAVARIFAPDSDLSQSWSEDEFGGSYASEWRAFMADLAAKLAGEEHSGGETGVKY